MKIAIVGLGLIGGSLAKAIKLYTSHTVMGLDIDPAVLSAAISAGAIDQTGTPESLSTADIVLVALYPRQSIDFITQNRRSFKKGTIVADCSGTKSAICATIPEIAAANDFYFIGGHPMAGKEKGGFESSDALLFQGASFIVVPCGCDNVKVKAFTDFIMLLGFSQTVTTSAQEHDSIIAYTSQLPHVLSTAYVLSPACRKHFGFSAGSFRDVSRVALINEQLWSQLFIENKLPLAQEIDLLIDNLALLKKHILSGEREELKQLLAKGRIIKQEV